MPSAPFIGVYVGRHLAGSLTFHSALLATPAVVLVILGTVPRVPKGYRVPQFLQ
jgi:hypothetical protein